MTTAIAADYHFPRGFLWGTTSAAYAVEGQLPAHTWAEWERLRHTAGSAERAARWWAGRWKEDLDRAAEGTQNAHRFSLEWSRIQPQPDKWDEDALDHYRQLARGARERGLMPLVTLHHFTDPLWFAESDGWEAPDAPQRFARYVRKAVNALREYVTYWVTINEPNTYAWQGYVRGVFPPGARNQQQALRVLANLARAHAAAYQAIHEIQPEARVGYAWHYRPLQADNPRNPLDRLARQLAYNAFNMSFPTAIVTGTLRHPLGRLRLPEVRHTQDFFGLNYELPARVRWRPGKEIPFFADCQPAHPKDSPAAYFRSLKWAAQFGKPILITANGLATADDAARRCYLAQHLHALWRAINFNIPVKGYFYRRLTDGCEWEQGWQATYGLWALDAETQQRNKRPSADLYAAICQANALTSEMVQDHCPQALPMLLPTGF